MSREGDTLILEKAHIEGGRAGSIGIKELYEFGREFGRRQGVSRVIVRGYTRTTGRHVGQVPRPIIIEVPK
jgi:hypothetical protein